MVRSPHGDEAAALDRPFALSEGFTMIDQSSGSPLSHDLNGDTRPVPVIRLSRNRTSDDCIQQQPRQRAKRPLVGIWMNNKPS